MKSNFYTYVHKQKLLKDPEFKKLYKESQPEFEIAKAIIKARIKNKITQKELAEKMKEVLTKLGDQTQNIDHDRLHGYTENIIMNEKVFELLEKLAKS